MRYTRYNRPCSTPGTTDLAVRPVQQTMQYARYPLYKRPVGPMADLDVSGEEKVSCPYWGSNAIASRYNNYIIRALL